jgi:hypothetical protein
MTQVVIRIMVPKVLGGCVGAADGQQRVFVTTEKLAKPSRIMTADSAADAH